MPVNDDGTVATYDAVGEDETLIWSVRTATILVAVYILQYIFHLRCLANNNSITQIDYTVGETVSCVVAI